MNAKDLIEIMRHNIDQVKQQGLESIPMQNMMEAWFSALKKIVDESPSGEPTPDQLEKLKGQIALEVEKVKSFQTGKLEELKAAFKYGELALKSAILINGAASVAILAFIGKIWGGDDAITTIKRMSVSLFVFVSGVLVGALASGFSYVTQYCYSQNQHNAGHAWRWVTIILTFSSYILFLIGSIFAYHAFVG